MLSLSSFFHPRGGAPPDAHEMSPPKKPTIERRLANVEASIAELKEQLSHLGVPATELEAMRDDVDELRSQLEARGVSFNPGAPPLSEQTRGVRAKNAAQARAAKDVGQGQGHVLTKATKRKLQKEARDAED